MRKLQTAHGLVGPAFKKRSGDLFFWNKIPRAQTPRRELRARARVVLIPEY